MKSNCISRIAMKAAAAVAFVPAAVMAQQPALPPSTQPAAAPCASAKAGENVGTVQLPKSGALANAAGTACSKFGICLHPKAKPVAVGGSDAKPCAAPATAQAPANASAATVAAPRELCPPGTSRVAGTPYCLKPDGVTLVDVVKVPMNFSTPVPPNPAAAPAAQR